MSLAGAAAYVVLPVFHNPEASGDGKEHDRKPEVVPGEARKPEVPRKPEIPGVSGEPEVPEERDIPPERPPAPPPVPTGGGGRRFLR
jgi:hypothetical protein